MTTGWRVAHPPTSNCFYQLLLSVYRLRGTGGDLVILEEAAFIDESVFNEVVIPLLEVSNTVLVGISTPLDKNNYYSSLVNLVDDQGKRVFHLFEAKNA